MELAPKNQRLPILGKRIIVKTTGKNDFCKRNAALVWIRFCFNHILRKA
jgi:hypothetical protein